MKKPWAHFLKKHCTFILVAFLFSGSYLSSQSFNFNHSSDTVLLFTPSNTYLSSQVTNPTMDTIEIDIIRVVNETPIDANHWWLSGMCIIVCQPANVDSFRIALPPDTTIEYKMLFEYFGYAIFDTAHTRILFRNVDDPSNTFVQDYYATLDPMYFGISNVEDINVNVYPNPVNDLLKIEQHTSQKDLKIKIIDLGGKNMIEQYIQDENTILDVSTLSDGMYIAVIEDHFHSIIYCQRIIKN